MIRKGGPRDVPFLRDMLRHAFYWRTPVGDEEPPLTRYVNAWGRPGDRSLIVFDDYVPVGAAWYRLFTSEDAGFGFIDERTPELAIAVVPSRRGRGFGHELLAGLMTCARKDGFDAVSLSVAKDNPAVHLYEKYGFEPVREDDGAVVMRAALSETPHK
ncbi:MAG TPA: GNAT family N-acetyltransferase [Gaiellaceae bacterium]|nr:GNAT family N-acetyltransferase [Gaiellaceae bacterium]